MKLHQPFYIEKRTRSENHLDLNGKWEFCYIDEATETPWSLDFNYECTIPSATYFNVYNAGILPHPYKEFNSRSYRFVDQKVWYYKCNFSLAEHQSLGKAFLCFDGVGYYTRLWVNGKLIGKHEGFFGGPIAEVNEHLKFGQENQIIVEIVSCNYGISDEEWERLYDTKDNPYLVPWNMVKDSHAINGDFTTMGIYRDVRLEIVPDIHISRPYLTTESIGEDSAHLHLSVEIVPENLDELKVLRNDIDGGAAYVYAYASGLNVVHRDVSVDVCIEFKQKDDGKTVYSETVSQPLYDNTKIGIKEKYFEAQFFEKDITIENPKLWYPLGLGDPYLYTVEITLSLGGKLLDLLTFDYGIRTFKLENTAGPRMRSRWGKFLPVINGKPFFLKAMNWTQLDQVLNVGEQDYRWALELAKNDNIQLIRVWGAGNSPEHDIFYKLCDEMGILVWQDSFISNHPNPYWDKSVFEAQQAMYLYRIRNHPSLVIHCSGNENNPYEKDNLCVWIWQYETEDIDPSRERIRTTPDKGGAHIYHGFEPCWFRKMFKALPFIGESGTHSFPNVKSFRLSLSEEEFNKPIEQFGVSNIAESHREFNNHIIENNSWGILKKVPAISHMCSTKDVTISRLCEASGVASFEYYQFMVQSMREQYPVTGGVTPWVFKRPFTTVAVQVVDGLGDPIAPYYAIKNAYKELEIHLALKELSYITGETVELDARIINESYKNRDVLAKIEVFDPRLKCVFKKEQGLSIGADMYQTQLPTESFVIPSDYKDSFFFLRASLYEDGGLISQSFYWPVVLSVLEDREIRTKRRTANCGAITHENGPWLMHQLEAITDDSIIECSIESIEYKDDRIAGLLILKNAGDTPAFPVKITALNDFCVQYLSDDSFFMAEGETRRIEFTLRNDEKLTEKVRFSVKAWNKKENITEA